MGKTPKRCSGGLGSFLAIFSDEADGSLSEETALLLGLHHVGGPGSAQGTSKASPYATCGTYIPKMELRSGAFKALIPTLSPDPDYLFEMDFLPSHSL